MILHPWRSSLAMRLLYVSYTHTHTYTYITRITNDSPHLEELPRHAPAAFSCMCVIYTYAYTYTHTMITDYYPHLKELRCHAPATFNRRKIARDKLHLRAKNEQQIPVDS